MARMRDCTEAKRAVRTLGTLGFVIGVVLAIGILTLQRSADRDISPQTMLGVAAENDILREELRGLLDRMRVLEEQEEKWTARIRERDKLLHVNSPISSAVPVSGMALAAVSTTLEVRVRPVAVAGL